MAEWINCIESFPPIGQSVLVTIRDRESGHHYVRIAQLSELTFDQKKLWYSNGIVFDNEVAYWQPLPNVPEGSSE